MWSGFDKERLSVVMPTAVVSELARFLVRSDEQEDICFVLWRPSHGRRRATAIVVDALLPKEGERHVHGDVSFEGSYFLRCVLEAREQRPGVLLVERRSS